MISLQQVSLSMGKKVLLENTSFSLFQKQKVGLVGRNGSGKSSLLKLFIGEISPDQGDFHIQQKLKISHLKQDLPESEDKALDYVLAGDAEYMQLIESLAEAEKTGHHQNIIACHQRLEDTAAYSKPAQAASILAGLGFSHAEQSQAVNNFSGGWRMRLNLARCLMSPADLFLLDEPTNHLDMEAIYWLERWIRQNPATMIIIAHDRDFLDNTVTHILHIEKQTANLYTGNYSQFEQMRAEKLALQQAAYEKQQKKIQHMMSFVTRFKAKASKAKQAQSRLKAIERIPLVAQAQMDSPFSFEFFPCPNASNPLIRCTDLSAGYQVDNPVLKQIKLTVQPGDRLALLGPNGEGKSTLIKTLTGQLPPLAGEIYHNPALKTAYFAQHMLEALDCSISPLDSIQALSPDQPTQAIRNFLGSFDFQGEMATEPAINFSGGEKARLVLAMLVWQKPNILLLDEPTNHLDLDMRAAIEIALQEYEGAMVLISHDRHLLNAASDSFYLVYGGAVKIFDGTLDDYYSWLQSPKKDTAKATANKNTVAKKHQQIKPLQNRLKKLESTISEHQAALSTLEEQLADNRLYEESQQQALNTLLSQQRELNQALALTEEAWLSCMEELEGLQDI